MTRQLKIFLLGIVIVIVESFVLAFVVIFLNFLLLDSTKLDSISKVLVLTLFFGVFKTLCEQWLFCMVVIKRVHKRQNELKLKDLIIGKAASATFMLTALILVIINPPRDFDFFKIYVLGFVPSIVIAYILSSRIWIKGVIWINTNKLDTDFDEV